MGLFYEPQPARTDFAETLEEALGMDKIVEASVREREADRMLRVNLKGKNVTNPNPVWWRVIIAFALAGALFVWALHLEGSPTHAESSKTLLHAFELSFTGLLALLGIETAKQKT